MGFLGRCILSRKKKQDAEYDNENPVTHVLFIRNHFKTTESKLKSSTNLQSNSPIPV
jgi:hypothetical protein